MSREGAIDRAQGYVGSSRPLGLLVADLVQGLIEQERVEHCATCVRRCRQHGVDVGRREVSVEEGARRAILLGPRETGELRIDAQTPVAHAAA
jgi:hypothetical protein